MTGEGVGSSLRRQTVAVASFHTAQALLAEP